jgi:RND family efflux transporter MFP subunit
MALHPVLTLVTAKRPVLALLLLGLFAVLGGCSKADASRAQQRPPPLVVVAPVEIRDVPVLVRAPVDLRPIAQADVVSKTLGYLDAVLVDRGDPVKKGQLLALVRPSDLPDQLVAARGVLAQQQASVALARSELQRVEAQAPQGLVSAQEVERARATAATAEAAEAASHAQVGALAVRLGEMRIESPLDGVVTQRRLDPGALTGPPNPTAILTVARVDVLRVFVAVSDARVRGVALGQRASVEVDGLPGQVYEGTVARLAPGLDPITRTLDAEVHLPNPGELRPGMYGRASILVDTHRGATVVPVTAVQISEAGRYVFVLRGDQVVRQNVETGVDGGDFFEITRGLARGDQVVTAGADGLSDGAKVRVYRGTDPFRAAGAPSAAASAR